MLTKLLYEFQARHYRHLVIRNNNVRFFSERQFKSFGAVVSRDDLVAIVAQFYCHYVNNVYLVVYNQYCFVCHCSASTKKSIL